MQPLMPIAKDYVNSNMYLVEEMEIPFSRSDYHVRYPIKKKMAGIYFICRQNGDIAYIGQTKNCIKSRIGRHKMSMNNPEWTGEKSGLKFHKKGIQDESFVLKYISADKLGLKTSHDLLAAEGLFVKALNPMLYGD